MENLVKRKEDEILTNLDPIAIIINSTKADSKEHLHRFKLQIQHLYKFAIFKNILDLMATKVHAKQLSFVVRDAQIFELDNGNCKTMTSDHGMMANIMQSLRRKKKYIITIKKIASDIIIHEVSHMVEHELGDSFEPTAFARAVGQDIHTMNTYKIGTPLLRQTIMSVMVDQVCCYPKDHQISELFARYFQLFAMAREMSTEMRTGHNIAQLHEVFCNTGEELHRQLQKKWIALLNKDIQIASERYIIQTKDGKSNASWGLKTGSVHVQDDKNIAKDVKWTRVTKPLHDA